MYSIAESKAFDIFILICISLNATIMSINHVGISDGLSFVLMILNYFFTGIFFIEMVIRLFAYGKNYFRDSWNLFDFFIVVGSSILIIISMGQEE